jgi:hypothetical protein
MSKIEILAKKHILSHTYTHTPAKRRGEARGLLIVR